MRLNLDIYSSAVDLCDLPLKIVVNIKWDYTNANLAWSKILSALHLFKENSAVAILSEVGETQLPF